MTKAGRREEACLCCQQAETKQSNCVCDVSLYVMMVLVLVELVMVVGQGREGSMKAV